MKIFELRAKSKDDLINMVKDLKIKIMECENTLKAVNCMTHRYNKWKGG